MDTSQTFAAAIGVAVLDGLVIIAAIAVLGKWVRHTDSTTGKRLAVPIFLATWVAAGTLLVATKLLFV